LSSNILVAVVQQNLRIEGGGRGRCRGSTQERLLANFLCFNDRVRGKRFELYNEKSMRLFVVKLSSYPANTSTTTYHHLIDAQSQSRISKFRRVEDAQSAYSLSLIGYSLILTDNLELGCLIGRLLPRYYLTQEIGLNWHSIKFDTTEKGRPFAVSASWMLT
jgi:hypothetical protein